MCLNANAFNEIALAGSVWGCVECALTVIGFLTKLTTVCCHLGKTDMDKGTLVKFIFMPGNELVNLFPGKPKPAPIRAARAPAIRERAEIAETLELQDFSW